MIHFIVCYGSVINVLGIAAIVVIIVFLWRYQKHLFCRCPSLVITSKPLVFRTPKKFWYSTMVAFGLIASIICMMQTISHCINRSDTSNCWLHAAMKITLALSALFFMVVSAYITEKNNYVSISLDRIEFRFGRKSEIIQVQSVQSIITSRSAFRFCLQGRKDVYLNKGYLRFLEGGSLLMRLIEEFGEKHVP